MGKLEAENRRAIRRTKIQEAIFITLISGGRRGSELIPRLVAEAMLGIDLTPPPRINEYIKTVASRLRRKGLLKFENGRYLMTSQGQNLWERWQREDFKLKKPKSWDRKWRIVIFDIPEKKRKIRDMVRRILFNAGFQRIQDSVWVYPYDCEDVIGLLKADYGIGRDMLYIIADQIENDKYLRMDFDLTGYD